MLLLVLPVFLWKVFLLEYKVRFLILAPPPHERMQLLKIMLPLTPATALAAKSVLNCLKLKLLHLEELEQEAEATTSIQEERCMQRPFLVQ